MDVLRPTNLNFLSIYWTLLFAVGLAVGLFNTRAALKERLSVIRSAENGRSPLMRLHAFTDALQGALREIGQFAGFVLGVWSFYLPPAAAVPVHSDAAETRRLFYAYALVLGLFVMEHCQIGIILVEFWRRWRADVLADRFLTKSST